MTGIEPEVLNLYGPSDRPADIGEVGGSGWPKAAPCIKVAHNPVGLAIIHPWKKAGEKFDRFFHDGLYANNCVNGVRTHSPVLL